MLVPNRHASSAAYRYGFGCMEKDNELKGDGNSYDFGARMYDPRVGRWFATDPLAHKYPFLSPYLYSGNSPILFTDYNGEDFGIKINHKTKTIVFVANIYTISDKTYKQAQKGASQWLDLNKKKYKSSGYTISFDIKVVKPLSIDAISDSEVIKENPSENFKNKKGELKSGKVQKYKRRLLVKRAKEDAEKLESNDKIGNLYSGADGGDSREFKSQPDGTKQTFVGGVTRSNHEISMNTHPDFGGDMGSNSDLVAHEIGHLLGLDDKGKGPYYSKNGVMVYKGISLDAPSVNDIIKIIQYANDFLSGKTKDGNVSVIEEIGADDGSSPIKTKNESNEDKKNYKTN